MQKNKSNTTINTRNMDLQAVANDLFDEIKSRYSKITLGDENASVTTNPSEARFFKFNWNQNPVSIAIDEDNLRLIYNRNLTDSVDSEQEQEWYEFAKTMKEFAVSHNLGFKPQDMEKLDLDQGDFEFLSQVNTVQESNMHGTSKTSYNKLDRTRMVIRHSKHVDEQVPGARSRNINAIFIENSQGERFRFPYNYLQGARAMQMHVAKGGNPYDQIGEAIVSKVEDIAKLRNFTKYALKQGMVDETTQPYLTTANSRIQETKKLLKQLSGTKTYEHASKLVTQEDAEVSEDNINSMIKMFTKETFDDSIVDAFKLLNINELKGDDEEELTKTDIMKLPSTAGRYAPAVQKFLNDPNSKLVLKKDDSYDSFQNNLRAQQKEVNLKLATIMRDIATRFLSANPEDDAIANFAADMDQQLVNQGELFNKPEPNIKALKGLAIKLANKYLQDMKRAGMDDDYKDEVRKSPEDMKAFKDIKGKEIEKGKLSKQYKRKYKEEEQFEAWALAQTEALDVVLEDETITKSNYEDPFKC